MALTLGEIITELQNDYKHLAARAHHRGDVREYDRVTGVIVGLGGADARSLIPSDTEHKIAGMRLGAAILAGLTNVEES